MAGMSTESLESVVRALVNRLAKGEYDAVLDQCSTSRLMVDDIRQVMDDYGRTFIEPPLSGYSELDAVAVRDAKHPTWSVRAPLWSKEEGRSDLTLEVTVIQDGDRWYVELDDLHVL
jgi:hypothetical protein